MAALAAPAAVSSALELAVNGLSFTSDACRSTCTPPTIATAEPPSGLRAAAPPSSSRLRAASSRPARAASPARAGGDGDAVVPLRPPPERRRAACGRSARVCSAAPPRGRDARRARGVAQRRELPLRRRRPVHDVPGLRRRARRRDGGRSRADLGARPLARPRLRWRDAPLRLPLGPGDGDGADVAPPAKSYVTTQARYDAVAGALACTLPAWPAGEVSVEAAVNGVDYDQRAGVTVTLLAPPTLTSLTPTCGPGAGGTKVRVKGEKGVDLFYRPTMTFRFGQMYMNVGGDVILDDPCSCDADFPIEGIGGCGGWRPAAVLRGPRRARAPSLSPTR